MTRTIAEIERQICQCPIESLKIFKQSQAIDRAIARAELEVLESIRCVTLIWSTSDEIVAGDLADRARYSGAATLAGLHAIKVAILSHPDLAEATTRLAPLFAELEAAKEQLAAEVAAAAVVAAERQAAITAATKKALADVDAKFASAPAEPAAPFRGKVKITAGEPELAGV